MAISEPSLNRETFFQIFYNIFGNTVLIKPVSSSRANDRSGQRNKGFAQNSQNEQVSDLYIGKSANADSDKFLKFEMTSLAIWEKELSARKVKDIYFAGK